MLAVHEVKIKYHFTCFYFGNFLCHFKGNLRQQTGLPSSEKKIKIPNKYNDTII